MNKTFFKIGLGLLALAGMAWPSRGDVAGMKTLHGHVPAVVARLARTGDLAETNQLHLAIGLQLRNQAALDDLMRQVSDPASSQYGHYLSTEDFTKQFAPSEADYQAVVDFARQKGLAVIATHQNRMLVEVTGAAGDVQKAFNVHLHTYQHPTENRTFFAPDSEPTVPAALAMLDISGLNNYARPHPALRLRSNAAKASALARPQLGSGLDGSYMGDDFRSAYVPGAPETGAGQNVALVQFDGYLASDIALYESLNNRANIALTNILLNGFNGVPTGNGGEVEVSLDIEMVISMAPGVNEVAVYEGDPINFLPNVVLNQIAVDDLAHQVSCSWGWTGGPNATSDQIFKEMIVQGQSFFHSSADSDAFLPGEVDNPGLEFFPSSSPFITQVGGTTLSTTGPDGAYVTETVWNWDLEFPGQGYDGVGSCGGVSSFYAIPWWQTNTSMTLNGGSTTSRNIPDVALTGDNVVVIADGGVFYPGTGGTSCASPLWAGFTALVNQQAIALGHPSVGFVNPALYALANSSSYTNVFNDITTGNNTWSQSPNLFLAMTNYDLCTGLGSPNGTNLINALAGITQPISISSIITPPLQPWGTTLSVMDGTDPNGLWCLFIQDDTALHAGTNYNGWLINLTTANPIGFPADNGLYVSATNISIMAGSQWMTTLAVTNYGPAPATNVYVADTLPDAPYVTLLSSNTTLAGSTLTNFDGVLVWSVGNLVTNAGGTLTLTFRGNLPGMFTNSATVSASSTDPNPDDNSVATTITIAQVPAPVISPHFYLSGGKGLQLTVTNASGSTVYIQASTNLLNWLTVDTNSAQLFTFTNFDNTNFMHRFYRALIQQ